MAIFFNPRTHCSGCGEVLKSMFFDFLICLLNVLSCILVFFIEPITTGQIVFVIMVTIITFGTYTFDLLSSDGCEHMLQIQKTMTLSTLISVIMWMCPISVFWSLIPLFFGIINSSLIMYGDNDDKIIESIVLLSVSLTGIILFILYINMHI